MSRELTKQNRSRGFYYHSLSPLKQQRIGGNILIAEKLKKAAVAGSGAMGHGIAELLAIAGYEVTMIDISDEFLRKRWSKLDNFFIFDNHNVTDDQYAIY
jgi:NADPH-dependent 2,4-dienoyl-CoA reductase/sulfur reductase-like enzyme